MIVTSEAETEGSGKLLSSLPCNTRTEAQCPTSCINQTEITSQISKQRELLADGATHVTDVRLKGQDVGGVGKLITEQICSLVLSETITSAESDLPLVIDDITNFRIDVKASVVLINCSTDTAADPPTLSVD